jgi:hypothetical protein
MAGLNKIIIDPHFCTQVEYQHLKNWLTNQTWCWSEIPTECEEKKDETKKQPSRCCFCQKKTEEILGFTGVDNQYLPLCQTCYDQFDDEQRTELEHENLELDDYMEVVKVMEIKEERKTYSFNIPSYLAGDDEKIREFFENAKDLALFYPDTERTDSHFQTI